METRKRRQGRWSLLRLQIECGRAAGLQPAINLEEGVSQGVDDAPEEGVRASQARPPRPVIDLEDEREAWEFDFPENIYPGARAGGRTGSPGDGGGSCRGR
eukprot:7920807-Heterocapsa_arctica.AAC.1